MGRLDLTPEQEVRFLQNIKAIAADRKDRYASPAALRQALTDWLQQN